MFEHSYLCWVVSVCSGTLAGFAFVCAISLRRRNKQLAKLHADDIRYWIEQRDKWRNLAERVAYGLTEAEHAERTRLN
jgi:hypothetical protein